MILSKTPLRISFAGGGTDYFNSKSLVPGRVIVTTINKYMYVMCNKRYNSSVRISYSQTENVKNSNQLKHNIIREALKYFNIKNGIELCTIADIPSSGSGLASSSALSVGLINVLTSYKDKKISTKELARQSCILEIDKCKKPIGMQDQISTSYGGLNRIEFFSNKKTKIKKIKLSQDHMNNFKNHLMLFYTGVNRYADKILGKIDKSGKKFINYEKLSQLAKLFEQELLNEDYKSCGQILHENWLLKKSLNKNVSSLNLDSIYNLALSSGAHGGKILGAGGGGYFLFVVDKKNQYKVQKSLKKLNLINFDFENNGSKIIKIND